MALVLSTLSKESSVSLMTVKSAHLSAACGPLLCWAPVQQLNSPLLRAAIICSTIYLSQRAVWITTPRLMASCHVMNIITQNTSGATHSVSLHRALPCWFYPRKPSLPVGSSIQACSTNRRKIYIYKKGGGEAGCILCFNIEALPHLARTVCSTRH